MAPSFEQFNGVKGNNESSDERKENLERISSKEAEQAALDEVMEFLHTLEAEADELLEAEPTVHLKGRDYRLDELPKEYFELGHMQKKHQIILDRMSDALIQNESAEAGSSEQDVAYFKVQILGRLKEVQSDHNKAAFGQLGLALQHPDLYDAYNLKKAA